jgi:hypothetical protein
MALETPYEIIELLKTHEIPFLVIGGVAVNYHGYIRATEDVDIIYFRSVKYISLEWLKKIKRTANRPRRSRGSE